MKLNFRPQKSDKIIHLKIYLISKMNKKLILGGSLPILGVEVKETCFFWFNIIFLKFKTQEKKNGKFQLHFL